VGGSAGAGEQLFPAVLPGPVPWQVQDQPPGGAGDPGRDGYQVSADGGGGGLRVEHRRDRAGGSGQVELVAASTSQAPLAENEDDGK